MCFGPYDISSTTFCFFFKVIRTETKVRKILSLKWLISKERIQVIKGGKNFFESQGQLPKVISIEELKEPGLGEEFKVETEIFISMKYIRKLKSLIHNFFFSLYFLF